MVEARNNAVAIGSEPSRRFKETVSSEFLCCLQWCFELLLYCYRFCLLVIEAWETSKCTAYWLKRTYSLQLGIQMHEPQLDRLPANIQYFGFSSSAVVCKLCFPFECLLSAVKWNAHSLFHNCQGWNGASTNQTWCAMVYALCSLALLLGAQFDLSQLLFARDHLWTHFVYDEPIQYMYKIH